MKTHSPFQTLLAGALLMLATCSTNAATYVVGLSPHYPSTDRDAVFRGTLQFILEGMSLGDHLVVYDALNQQPVTQFTMPREALLQRNARARAQRLKSEIAALQKFLAVERPHPAELASAIHVPEVLALAGAQLRKPGENVQVVLIGSPFYANTNEPAYNMTETVVSDAHIIADQGQTLFGTANKQGALQGVTVHYAYLRECFVNSFHKERTGRFWALFVQALQDGTLATFAPDLSLAFERARAGVNQSCVTAQVDPNDSKIEMRRVVPRSPPSWLVRTADSSNAPASRPVATIPATLPIAPTAGKIGVGIMWNQRLDLDLWLKPTPSARELGYPTSVTSEGRYFHDYRDANAGVDYEYIELKDGLDLQKMKCFVNIFAGRASSASGTVVLHYQGKAYQSTFALRAATGNNGGDFNRREQSPYWVEIDLAALVRLPTGLSSNEAKR